MLVTQDLGPVVHGVGSMIGDDREVGVSLYLQDLDVLGEPEEVSHVFLEHEPPRSLIGLLVRVECLGCYLFGPVRPAEGVVPVLIVQ